MGTVILTNFFTKDLLFKKKMKKRTFSLLNGIILLKKGKSPVNSTVCSSKI
jgi:hypothetical protein